MSKKQLRVFVWTLAILAFSSILFAACTRPGASAVTSGTPKSGTSSPSSGGSSTVHMGAVNFVQNTVTISKGSMLTLIDDVQSPHTIMNGMWVNNAQKLAKESGAPTVSAMFMQPNESKQVGPFTIAGTYHILCTIHLNMNLTITVK